MSASAITAYNAGATGRGVKIGIVDSGLNPNLAEFAGRIDPASRNIRGGGPVSATEFHGTSVAAVAAAARNGSGMQGLAFDATIIALNSSDPTNCPDDQCKHDDADIARGVDIARTAGARVINISLGGSAPGSPLVAALSRATQEGIIVVFSAGNDGAANPDPLPLESVRQAGNGLILIAGAVDTNGAITSFSNRAGIGANFYLTALGELVRSFDETGAGFLFSGTSYSAPTISGAVALLASAFPNLTGAQIVDLLFRSATDAGGPGIDSVYGRGTLNLARAFQPQGQTSIAGGTVPITLEDDNQASGAMGDAIGGNSFGAVILDGYSRAFAVEFAGRLARAPRERPLGQSLLGDTRSGASAAGPLAVSVTVSRNLQGQPQVGLAQTGMTYEDARRAKALAGYALGRISPKTAMAFGFAESGRALQQRLQGAEQNAFLVARDPSTRNGFYADAASSVGVRQELGAFGLTAIAETGAVWADRDPRIRGRSTYSIGALTADRRFGPAWLSVGLSYLAEEETVLGGRFTSAFTSGGARSWFVDGAARYDLGGGWRAFGSYRRGWTEVPGSGALVAGGALATEAWAFDIAGRGLFTPGDRLAFRVMQPLRVASGGFDLSVPVSYDYASGRPGFEQRFFNLAPTGREIDLEAAYGMGLWGGDLSLNAYMRRQPGHIAEAEADLGAALRFSLGF